MDDIAKIAEGLTEAQREAFNWVRPWSIIAQYRTGFSELLRLGLVEPDNLGHSVTAKGLAVRAHLEGER